MDLSWCIICDKRIEDDELSMMDSSSSLYCSQDCKSKDDSSINTEEEDEKRIIFKPTLSTSKSTTSSKKPKYPLQHKSTSSTTYPWIPLYRKRHHNNVLLNAAKRYCQPSVAGSPINATAVLSSSLIR